MKKIITVLLLTVSLFGMLPSAYASYSDVSSESDYYASAVRLYDLGIITGYTDGTFRPNNSITRAEFTKTVICMMDKDKEASASASASGFYDVEFGSWAAPYINYAVGQDILSGYSDGSFGPNNTIKFCEAVTILMRTLGYSESDVGYYWPNNYMTASSALGLTADMNYDYYAPLTRATAAILTDRALFAKPAASKITQNSDADTYLETIGYTVLDDALVLDFDTSSSNVSILSGNLKLNNASTYISKTQIPVATSDTYEYAVIDKNGYLSTLKSYGSQKGISSETATINRLTGNTIEYTTTDGRKGTYKADDSFVTYYDNSKLSFSQAKSYISNGADITFYGENYGLWNIAVLGSSNDVDPVLATKNYTSSDITLEGITIQKSNLTVYRDGEAATLSDIKQNDVVYYNTKTNIMDVYSKKVTGIYYDAYPSKAYVESITVGGKSYEIGYSAATRKLDASAGAFDIGDKVTLLLGKNEKIVFCIDNSSSFDYFEYGVLLSTTTQIADSGISEGNTEIVASMFMPDGQTHKIVVNKQYNDNIGDLMHITYSDGIASLTKQKSSQLDAYEGTIDKISRTVNGKYVLKDAVIIQRTSESDSSAVSCELLDFDNLTANKITSAELLGVIGANNFGDIAIMYVQNLESTYSYGVIGGFIRSGADKDTTGYKIFSDSMLSTYQLSNIGKINTSIGSAVGFKTENGQLKKITALSKIGSSGYISAVEGSRIMLGQTIYKVGADVQVIDITDTVNMRNITIDELGNMKNISSVTLYSDKSLLSGGVVRVITVVTGK